VVTTERIERVLEPTYVAHLEAHDTEHLRSMKHDCSAIETAVSYSRRLAQARVEILEAEQRRRAEGGSLSELIDKLPKILAGDAARSSAAHTRHAEPEAEILVLTWQGSRERLLEDDSLANLPTVADADLGATIIALRDFERELSGYRRSLHEVIEGIEHEIATRAAAGN
jgi:hypothetical protein